MSIVLRLIACCIFATLTQAISKSRNSLEARIALAQLDHAIEKANDLLSLIYNRYEYNTPRGRLFVTMQSNMKEKDFELIKLIFLKKLTANKPKYKMVFGGSSVTAGHDNFFKDSHPKVLETRMRPIFEALGVEFEVRNIAQGANDCAPSNMCYEAMAGEGGDFFLWEQSFNCGRDLRYVEMIVRLAARHHASVYIMSSGGIDTRKCPPSREEKPLRSDSNYLPSKNITFTEENIKGFKDDMIFMNSKGQSMGDRAYGLMKSYPHAPPSSGMNVFFNYPNSVCQDVNPTLKNCGIDNIMKDCSSLKFLSKEASVYSLGGGVAHHPSRAMHMMRGEVIAWSYTLALLEAMYTIRRSIVSGGDLLSMHNVFSTHLAANFSTVKKPKQCGGEPFFCEQRYSCFTDYSPKYIQQYSLKELAVETATPSKWKYKVHPIPNKQTDRIDNADKEMRSHFSTREGRMAGELFLRVNIVSNIGRALVCWEGFEKKNVMSRLEYRFDLNVGEKAFSPDFVYVPSNNRTPWDSRVEFNPCMSLNNIPLGVHVLGLESKGGNSGVSHLITWDNSN